MNKIENIGDQREILKRFIESEFANIWTTFPARVEEVNHAEWTVKVRPYVSVKLESKDNTFSDVWLPLLIHVPLCFPNCNGLSVTYPINVGCDVLVTIASRNIDTWWDLNTFSPASEYRIFDLSDGFAVPNVTSRPKVKFPFNADAVEVRNEDGSVNLQVSQSEVKIKSPTTTVEGNLKVTGNVECSDLKSSSVTSLNSHKHSGVMTGGGQTGGPV